MRIVEVVKKKNEYQQAADLIVRNCQPYLTAIKNQLESNILYRGINVQPGAKVIIQSKCPVNRKPTLTPIEQHHAADDWFFEKTGIRYRSNAVFCTGNRGDAGSYGNMFIIFPIGNFSFCYSPKIDDLTPELDEAVDNYLIAHGKMPWHDTPTPKQISAIVRKVLRSGNYKQNNNLIKAIHSGNEVMVHCDTYYAVPVISYDDIIDYITNK